MKIPPLVTFECRCLVLALRQIYLFITICWLDLVATVIQSNSNGQVKAVLFPKGSPRLSLLRHGHTNRCVPQSVSCTGVVMLNPSILPL